MRFLRSIKWRITTVFLGILLFVLCVVVGFSYFLLAQAVYSNEGTPSRIYTTEIDIPDSVIEVSATHYEKLTSYTISGNHLDTIRDGSKNDIRIQTSLGILTLDQSIFIPDDAQGDQNVWIYYRVSPTDLSKYELMIFVRGANQTRLILGHFANILILALPFALVLAFFIGYVLLKRMLQPIGTIAETVRKIDGKTLHKKIELPSITEFDELTADLNQAFERIQETVDLERQIVADTSHEIRAPLTVMQGEATLVLRRKRTVEEYEECLRVFSRESTYLSSIVNKLLLIAQLDSSPELLDVEEIDLSDLLNELSPSFKLLCEEHDLAFKFEAEVGVKIHGNRLKLRELFFNLVDNAVKYNRDGGEVSLLLKMDYGYARVDISDKGIGIQQKHLGKLFERFYRIDKSFSRSKDGAGLGLAICKRIVDMHHGKIEVQSEIGKGSTFSVYLPLLNKA